MTKERLLTILAAYGAESARWPAAERAAALDLLAREPDLARAAAAEAALDRALAAVPSPAPSAALLADVLAAAVEARAVPEALPAARPFRLLPFAARLLAPPQFGRGLAGWRMAGAALLFTIGAGFGAGISVAGAQAPEEVEMMSMLWNSSAYDESSGWAYGE